MTFLSFFLSIIIVHSQNFWFNFKKGHGRGRERREKKKEKKKNWNVREEYTLTDLCRTRDPRNGNS